MQVLASSYAIPNNINNGYIAGLGAGIVTVAGKPASRKIWLFNVVNMAIEQVAISTNDGHYLFLGLDANKEYLVLARDFRREFEPFAWDYVQPANDLTIAEQQALWQSWQT